MITLDRTAFDAPPLLDRVERLIAGAVALARPESVRVVQVDDWFDSKWVAFSGKLVGAVGFRTRDLTVPPFHPNRVLRELGYCRDAAAAGYVPDPAAPPLHAAQPSERNTRRHLRLVAPGAACFWYTSASAPSKRGALMAYVPTEGEYWAWYVALARAEPAWRVTRRKGITPGEQETLERAGSGTPAS
ncbi:MAG TPA: hypothetical protein VJU87_08015 [Gemmatimonadaceae bacterium]|nr:hypothetical protein [Gemmatimonadaceae bacterium]